jgi:DNA-binding beta-propeller fold protein YncE
MPGNPWLQAFSAAAETVLAWARVTPPSVDVYVSDLSDDYVSRIASKTGAMTPIPGAHYTWGLAVDSAGNVYLAHGGLELTKLPADGGPATKLPRFQLQQYGVAVDWSDNIYSVGKTNDSGGNYAAMKIPADGGQAVKIWDADSDGSIADEIAVDQAGNVYILRGGVAGVLKIPVGGGPHTFIPLPVVPHPRGGGAFPRGLAVDPAGQYIYFTDGQLKQVFKLPMAGGPTSSVGTDLDATAGVAVDHLGNVYVASMHDNRVVQVNPLSGRQITICRTKWPHAVAVQPHRASDRHDPDLVGRLFGGADRGGDGWLVIGDHFIHIPPRSPVMLIIAEAVRPYLGRAVEDPELAERLRQIRMSES